MRYDGIRARRAVLMVALASALTSAQAFPLPEPKAFVESVQSGGKIVGVSWFGAPLEFNIDLLRERSLRYLFPDISTLEHLQHTVGLVASGRVRLKPTITHVLEGIEQTPKAFEITAHKSKYKAINPAQVRMCA